MINDKNKTAPFEKLSPLAKTKLVKVINAVSDQFESFRYVTPDYKEKKSFRLPFLREEKPSMNSWDVLSYIKIINTFLDWEKDVRFGPAGIERLNEKITWESIVKKIVDIKKHLVDSGENSDNRPVKRFIEFKDGYFYCKDKIIDFPDNNAIYVLLIKALHFESDSDGFLSYENIDKYISKEAGVGLSVAEEKKKRIYNALQNLSRKRKDQMNHFPEKAPDGQSVIRQSRGKGLIYYNPQT